MDKMDAVFKHRKTLIWAVDPNQSETRPSAESVQAMVQMAEQMNWQITPVSVLYLNPEREAAQSVNDATALLNAYVKSFELPKDCEPRLVVSKSGGQEAAVKGLIHFAQQSSAAAIAVSSHGRSGLDRFFLGSFAENALKESPVPVLFLRREKVRTGSAIFFPTDFSADSLYSFRHLLKIASGAKMKLIVFHVITFPLPPDMGVGVYVPDNFLTEQEAWAKKEGGRWVAEAAQAGFDAEAVIRTGGGGAVTCEDILAAAGELGAGMVVLTTKGGAMERTLFGSIAYPVFRANPGLTFVYGPKSLHHKLAQANHG